MSYYGGTITVKGRDLITSLIAGETIEFTRIVVGSGQVPEGVEPIDMEALVEPVAEATSTVPTVENSVLSMVVEYRNDLNGGLQTGFWLREFGIFAKTENSEEIGVRPVIDREQADKLLAAIPGIQVEMTANWNHRYRENLERLKSGNLLEVAAVVKGLTLRDARRGLSTGERKMLHSARQILISELVLSTSQSYEDVEAELDTALA